MTHLLSYKSRKKALADGARFQEVVNLIAGIAIHKPSEIGATRFEER